MFAESANRVGLSLFIASLRAAGGASPQAIEASGARASELASLFVAPEPSEAC
jgi:hypothetical protein